MLTKKQLGILTVFVKEPFAEITRQELKRLSKEKSNNALAIAMQQFKKEKLIDEKKVGKSALYMLNLSNDAVFYYIALANHNRLKSIVHRTINILKEEVKRCTEFCSIALFGSYAVQEETKKSDIDIAIFIEDESKKKQIEAAVNSAELKSLLPLDGHVITRSEFIEMLTNEEENLGKQIARKHLVVHNHQLFYDLVKGGMKRGFSI